MSEPQDAPPSYSQATGSSTTSTAPRNSAYLEVPNTKNGIPAAHRKSMEDEQRPLPSGWVRQWDSKEQHQFFVDTKADPPRSIWHHPYDDDDFLKTLSSEERERIQELERGKKLHFDSTDDEGPVKPIAAPSSSKKEKEKSGFGRRLKDKVTGTTHEERQADRAQRQEEEKMYYEAHLQFREALQRAQMTGQPQFLAKDKDGRDVYVEPPQSCGGGGYGAAYARQGYGYNPYSSGPYTDPNARFIRPQGPYGRPYGPYGGGMGMPIAGGLLGGMLLGGLLF